MSPASGSQWPAGYGSDFSGLGGSVTLNANQSSKTVPFNTIDDAVAEDAETVIVTIQGGSSYRVLTGGGTATQTITDNEPTVSVSASGAAEGGSDGQVTVSRSGPDLSGSLAVPLSAAGAVKIGDDYKVDGGTGLTITIPAGASSKTVPLAAVDDTKHEGSEDGTLTVQSSQGYHIGTGMAGFTITDNDKPVVSIAASGSASEDGATATLTVTRGSDDKKDQLTVYLARGGSASLGDYSVGPVVIPAHQDSVQVTVTAVNDSNHENPEQATFTVSTTADYTVAGSGTATVTVGITDNDKPRVSLSATVGEAAEGGAVGELTVTRTNDDVLDALAVELLYPTGSADPGTDYTAALGVTIPQGQATATIAVTAVDDPIYEGPEAAVFALDPAGDYDAGGGSAAVTIRDNEPTVSVSAAGAAAEGGAGASLTVTRSGGTLEGNLSVALTAGGSAGYGADYTLGGGLNVTILNGQATATVTLVAVDDPLPEGTERAVFAVAPSAHYRAAGEDIFDNEGGRDKFPRGRAA